MLKPNITILHPYTQQFVLCNTVPNGDSLGKMVMSTCFAAPILIILSGLSFYSVISHACMSEMRQ